MSKPKDRNTKLMEACGSKNGQWDPEAPDQNLYRMNHGDHEEQYVAYVYSCTCGHGRNSPFAVDQDGNVVTVKRVAAHFGWGINEAEQIARKAEQHGRILRDQEFNADKTRNTKRRLWYRADVPAARIARQTIATPAIEGIVQNALPSYILKDLAELGPEKCRKSLEWYAAFCMARNASFAEVKLNLWDTWDQLLLEGWERCKGVNPRRIKKRAPRDPIYVRDLKLEVPDFVRIPPPEFVRRPKTSLYNRENEFVPNPGPLSHTDQTSKDLYSGPPSASADAEGVQPVPIPGLVETPDALDSISKREIRTGQTGPHVSLRIKLKNAPTQRRLSGLGSCDLNGGGTQFPERSARPPQNKAVKRTTEATIVRVSAESEKTQCQTKKRKHA